MRSGLVYINGIRAGRIIEGETEYRFEYDAAYLEHEDNEPVSLTLPLNRKAYVSRLLFPFFDGLIPEGWLLDVARINWKIDPRDRMGLLLALCNDCIGNVSIRAEKEAV